MNIRLALSSDIASILALERASPAAAQWTEQQYVQLFEGAWKGPNRLVLVADSSMTLSPVEAPSVVGFLVARHAAAEWELENLMVAPVARRCGLGKQLLQALLVAAHKSDSPSVFLEVRESNTAARALYEKTGFRMTGRRKAYYSSPSEDALLYRIDVD